MSISGMVVNQINKLMQKAATRGDTRGVNRALELVESSTEVANRIEKVKAVNNEWKEEGLETEQYIHRSTQEGLHEGNFNYRSGSTPAAAGKGEGIFTTPVGSADETKAFGPNEYIVTSEKSDTSKLGHGQMELAAGDKNIPETFVPKDSTQRIDAIDKVGRDIDPTGTNADSLLYLPTGQEVGLPHLNIGADRNAQKIAGKYMQKSGLEYKPPIEYKKVDPRFSQKVANAFENMKHDPENPEVKEAYGAMINETAAQYDELVKGGLKLEFIQPGQANPYPNPRMMTEDVRNNNHMWIFPTEEGFGSGSKFPGNPLEKDSGYIISGQKATNNDLFRAVHDYFGHVKEGVGFRADGEENAFLAHSSMFSPKAQRALATETRGQNSWVNYGPKGRANRKATDGTVYADQKIGLLPRKFTDVDKSVHLPVGKVLKPAGETVIEDVSKFVTNFKTSLDKMYGNNKVKKFFADKNLPDEVIAGMGVDVLRMLNQNSAGKFRKLDGVKVYERLSQQDLLDKIGRRLEARLMKAGDDRMTPLARRELGAIMLEYTKGNFGRFITEDMVTTAKGKKLFITTNSEFNEWSSSKKGSVIMKSFDDTVEARQPSTKKPHGNWEVDAEGNVTKAPEGSDPGDFLAGGSKANLSQSVFPSVITSLNTLGGMRTGMNKEYFSIWKNLGKKGYFPETAGPVDDFRARMAKSKLSDSEKAELEESFEVIKGIGETYHDGNLTGKQWIDIKESVFTPRLKSLETILKETTTAGNQRIAKQSATRRTRDELERRFDDSDDGGAYFQYNVDSRGRAYPVDGSGASLNSGGAIRHGFTGETKPIQYGDQGFKQLVDDMILFDNTANLSKIQGSGLDRHAHWIKNEAKYLKQGNDALDNFDNPDWKPKWLKGQKDKGPYLAAVMEIARVKRASEKGVPHQSNMMIEIDAPSSGSQHIGAQYGDKEILWQTSVLSEPEGVNRILNADEIASLKASVPDDSIARDLYTEVGTIYERKRDVAFKNLEATDPQKAQAFKFFSDKFISGGRGVTKPIVMKVPYGAGDDSLRKDMVKQLTGRQRLEMADAGVDAEELMDFHWDSMKGALDEGLATQMEFKKFNKTLGGIYKNATNRKPFKVMGPDGSYTDLTRYTMDSVQGPTFKIKGEGIPDQGVSERQIKVYSAEGKVDTSSAGVGGYEVDTKALVQGLSPNVTHSMDAAYLHRLVNAAKEQGINLRVVHDAFFAHPNDVAAVKKLAGKVFQDMHANYDFRSEMIKGLSEATGESVESIMGQLQSKGINLDRGFDIGQVPSEQLGNIIRGG